MKQITVRDEFENKYYLSFNANAVKTMEKWGFNANEITTKPETMVTLLWYGAFLAEHKNTTNDTKDKMYAIQSNKAELLTKLLEMYSEVLDELVSEGNAQWEANF